MSIGLNLGSKLQIADKSYRVLNDLIDVKKMLGAVRFVGIEGHDVIYQEERQPDGTVANVMTDEIRGVKLDLQFKEHSAGDTVLITDMPLSEIEGLNLAFYEEVELVDPVVSISSIGRDDHYKVFASKIQRKSSSGQPKTEQKKDEQHQHKN